MKTSVTAAFILLIFTVVATTAMAAPDRTGTGPFDANGNEVIESTVYRSCEYLVFCNTLIVLLAQEYKNTIRKPKFVSE